VAPAEIRTCNLSIANPALYTTQSLAHWELKDDDDNNDDDDKVNKVPISQL